MLEAATTSAELATILAEHGRALVAGAEPRVITARVRRVCTTQGELAIKIFAADERPKASAEAMVLAHLQGDDHGYRVQHLLRPRSGHALVELGERCVLVTRWEEGEHRPYAEIDPSGWAALGRTLAALHRRLDDAPPLGLARLLDEIRDRDLDLDRALLEDHRRRATKSHAPETAAMQRWLDDRSTLLERHATRCQRKLPVGDDAPIHNDYNVHNFLFQRDGPPTILDWERSILAPRELEVMRCLNHLPLVAPASAWTFVEGYLERRALDPQRIAWAADASIRAHALKHWPVEPWLAGAAGAAERIPGIAEITRALVDGQDRLAAFVDALQARLVRGRS